MGLGIPSNCIDKPLYIKIIFGLPLLTASIQLLLLSYVFIHDSPKYFLTLDKKQEVAS
jgi:hypothetical protein